MNSYLVMTGPGYISIFSPSISTPKVARVSLRVLAVSFNSSSETEVISSGGSCKRSMEGNLYPPGARLSSLCTSFKEALSSAGDGVWTVIFPSSGASPPASAAISASLRFLLALASFSLLTLCLLILLCSFHLLPWVKSRSAVLPKSSTKSLGLNGVIKAASAISEAIKRM